MMARRRRAFTLIELLVVIAIIGMLLAVLIPALQYAKMQATGVVCLSNLNGIAKSWTLYAGDNDALLCNGHVPRHAQYDNLAFWLTTSEFGGPYKDNAWWVDPPHRRDGTYTGDPIPCPLEDEAEGIRTGALFPYTDNLDIYHCPGDKNYLRATERGGKRSYAITGLMNGEQPNHFKCVRKSSEIVNASNKYVFVEHTDPRGWIMGSWIIDPYKEPPTWIDALAIFHKDRSTLGFADGHAEKHRWVDESTLAMSDTGAGSGAINWAAGEGEDIRYMVRWYVPGVR